MNRASNARDGEDGSSSSTEDKDQLAGAAHVGRGSISNIINAAAGTGTAASSTWASSSVSWLRLKDPRIVRVSRAFGGKDRHSKVCTVRGLRDRRVRLSVPTAVQLYDLQDRLGLSQPSKVVDWLLDAAKTEIDELPPLQIPPADFIQSSLESLNNKKAAAAAAAAHGIKTNVTSETGNVISTSSPTSDNYNIPHHHDDGHGGNKDLAEISWGRDHERRTASSHQEKEKQYLAAAASATAGMQQHQPTHVASSSFLCRVNTLLPQMNHTYEAMEPSSFPPISQGRQVIRHEEGASVVAPSTLPFSHPSHHHHHQLFLCAPGFGEQQYSYNIQYPQASTWAPRDHHHDFDPRQVHNFLSSNSQLQNISTTMSTSNAQFFPSAGQISMRPRLSYNMGDGNFDQLLNDDSSNHHLPQK